jgi:hypothetical protein
VKKQADDELTWLDENKSSASTEEIKEKATKLREKSMSSMPNPNGTPTEESTSSTENTSSTEKTSQPNIEEVD